MDLKQQLMAMSHEEAVEQYMAAAELLAAVLNETGPVDIDKNNRKPIPPNAGIMVDVNNETQVVTVSLVDPDAAG